MLETARSLSGDVTDYDGLVRSAAQARFALVAWRKRERALSTCLGDRGGYELCVSLTAAST
ncbi:MAG: hypothetical protein QOF27_1625 [Gaiellaceae bacterium]|jgi:hypothetical protein|nr:hypothetical protein [Gaiellaceae bacterium]